VRDYRGDLNRCGVQITEGWWSISRSFEPGPNPTFSIELPGSSALPWTPVSLKSELQEFFRIPECLIQSDSLSSPSNRGGATIVRQDFLPRFPLAVLLIREDSKIRNY
jgi:hypothetical protein